MFCSYKRLEDVAASLAEDSSLVAIDLETTGLSWNHHHIIEVGAARFDLTGRVIDSFESLANPGKGYAHGGEHVHGISESDVLSAKPLPKVLQAFREFVGGSVVVAHFAQFENHFLTAEMDRLGMAHQPLIGCCTVHAARRILPGRTSYKLADVGRMLGHTFSAGHRSLVDARACAQVAVSLLERHHSKSRRAGPVADSRANEDGEVVPANPGAVRSLSLKHSVTPEQRAIRQAFMNGKSMKIIAGAGTGKTTTLQYLANSSSARITYLAFNRSVAEEASRRFGPKVYATTIHALAFRSLQYTGTVDLSRLHLGVEPMGRVAERVGIKDRSTLESLVGEEKAARRLGPEGFAACAVEAVRLFCLSNSRRILVKHAEQALTRQGAPRSRELAAAVQLFAEVYWDQAQNPKRRKVPLQHYEYLKMWLLGKPGLSADSSVLFVDEAQDLNPAVSGFIETQSRLLKVIVGDPNQSVYGFSGAGNAMSQMSSDIALPLTVSWRFGHAVAKLANGWLRTLGSPHTLTGNSDVVSEIVNLERPEAVLTRTNASAMHEAFAAQNQGLSTALLVDAQFVRGILDGAERLQAGLRADAPLLSWFSSWDEVLSYDGPNTEVVVWARLIRDYGIRAIRLVLDASVPHELADVVISTAHKAKGLEWHSVKIADDFDSALVMASLMGDAEVLDEERRLAYVATTRAQKRLDPGPLSDPY